MFLEKASDKLSSKTESKKSPAQSESGFSSHHRHEKKTKGGGEPKKMMKSKSFKGGLKMTKSTSFKGLKQGSLRRSLSRGRRNDQLHKPPKPNTRKASDGLPNYMKPTTSSDAKKERVQVTAHFPETNGDKDPKSSKRISLPAMNSGSKPAKALARKSSFRLRRRPSMKKTSGFVLRSRSINRATCSSTLKDSRVPKALDLNSGGTESDGTSFIKVCPYTHCSLNGHRHESLPPLRRFLSARRRVLKNQKSMRLKRLSSFRSTSFRKVGEGISNQQITIGRFPSDLDIDSVIEDLRNDFFIEIYDKPQEQSRDLNREIAEIVNSLTLMGNEYGEIGMEEDDLRATENEIPETHSDISFGYQHSENSTEILECDQQAEAEEETFLCFVPKVNEEGYPELYLMDGNERQQNSVAGNKIKDNTIVTTGTEEENIDEVEDAIANTQAHFCDFLQGFVETDQVITEGDCIQSETEMKNSRCKDATQNSSSSPEIHHFTSNTKSDEGYSEVNQQSEKEEQADCAGAGVESPEMNKTSETEAQVIDQPVHGATGNQQPRHNVHKERMIGHSEEIKEFNPRQPNFLPVKPETEAEKAYLRHHSMDKRKDADAWMIDFALQNLVLKLTPARNEKVALLVDAFEKVKASETDTPQPLCESPAQSPTSESTHARHVQACN